MEESAIIRPNWKRRLGVGAVDIVTLGVSLAACFMTFIMGAFASDSGTTEAMLISFSIIGFAGLYALGTLICVILSQLRNSYKLAIFPIILPILFFIWISVA